MRTLTIKQLTDADACAEQVKLFRAKFGDSVGVTPELCRSVVGKFEWDWAAANLLSPDALADYEVAMAAAWDAYLAAMAAAWDAYLAASPDALDTYRAATAAERDAYLAASAAAWAEAYISDRGEGK